MGDKVRKPCFVASNGAVKVPVYRRDRVKGEKTYTSFIVTDYSSGERDFQTFSDFKEAKEKAQEIAGCIATGRAEVLAWEDGLRTELRLALRTVEPTGIKILPACQMFADAVKILGSADQLLLACQHWKVNGPAKALTPMPTKKAVEEFMKRQEKARERRKRTLSTYLLRFGEKFEGQMLHEIEAAAITDFVDEQGWAPKTRNDSLSVFGLLFKETCRERIHAQLLCLPRSYQISRPCLHPVLTLTACESSRLSPDLHPARPATASLWTRISDRLAHLK